MKRTHRLLPLLVAFGPALALAASFAGVEVPAPPAPRPVVDTHWGVKVEDPYRFLEDTKDPEVQKFMKALADAASAILARIPGREAFAARLREIDAATPGVVNAVTRDDKGGLFYLKREAKDNQFKLVRREPGSSAERVLVDPTAGGATQAISSYTASPDGRLVTVAISAGGAEIGTMRVLDVATGKEVSPAIDRIRGGAVAWLPDGSGFFYSRLAPDWDKRPRAERFLDNRAWLRKLADPANDVAVFGPGLHYEVAIERSAFGFVMPVPGKDLVAAIVAHGVDRNISAYLAEKSAMLEGKPRWRKIVSQADQVKELASVGDTIYALTARDAPRYKVVAMKLPAPDISKATTVIAAGDDVVVDIMAASDALYVTKRSGAAKQLVRIAHAPGAKPEPVTLPFEGNVSLAHARASRPGVILTLAGWTRASRHYELGAGDSSPRPMDLVAPGQFDAPAGLVTREVRVKSHDGVEVPVSIIHRAGLALDGRAPAMLYGYGAYGSVEEPSFNPRLLPWLENGGVYALAHVRGGGIYGDAWHRAGWKTTKHNTWKDGIAAAEWLVANGYTAPGRLSIYGGSAGGIFVGRAITERPDLFSAAVIGVGNTDSVRSETRANGVGNIPEYGTVTKEDEFRGLLAMSPYANVKPGSAYPAVLFEHGVNDTRVDVWMTLKTGSRLAAATASGRPVLMRLEYDAGHGPGATRDQAIARLVDRWAFLLWQAGLPGYQPAAPAPR